MQEADDTNFASSVVFTSVVTYARSEMLLEIAIGLYKVAATLIQSYISSLKVDVAMVAEASFKADTVNVVSEISASVVTDIVEPSRSMETPLTVGLMDILDVAQFLSFDTAPIKILKAADPTLALKGD